MGNRLTQVVQLYGHYGPSRLPLGDRRDIGGGYSMAIGVLVGGLVFALWMVAASGEFVYYPVNTLLDTAALVLSTVPVYAVTGFVVGMLTWRSLSSSVPYYSPALITVVGNYLVGTAVWLLLAPVSGHAGLDPPIGTTQPTSLTEFLGDVFRLYPSVTLVVVLWTIWIAVPLSLFFSYVYECSRSGEFSSS